MIFVIVVYLEAVLSGRQICYNWGDAVVCLCVLMQMSSVIQTDSHTKYAGMESPEKKERNILDISYV